ncbi:hypothetical protein CYMTET_54318 [Cymbomonas tetramitiformis]|uniref:Histidine biosynthesis HisG C-terminal domain-containing protein n=1 Tax=Cymbomonas tetramitiformis TaxID=36881 RepID=A0AAE0BGG4_9CHLO|nr:hypothetical protein CYMTET_54318 [Cymbomonas tetramitiformis]
MRGESQEDVARIILDSDPLLGGLQGPTVSRVFTRQGDVITDGAFYAITIMIPKDDLYRSIKQIRKLGGSGVIVSPCTYVYEEEPERWTSLLKELGIEDYDEFVNSIES